MKLPIVPQGKRQRTSFWAFYILFALTLYACKESSTQNEEIGQASVSVTMLGVESEVEETPLPNLQNSATIQRAATPTAADEMVSTLALDEYHKMDVRMERIGSPTSSNPRSSTSSGNRMATQTVTTALGNGVRYRLLAYNTATGQLAAHADYSHGTAGADMLLDAGTRYTFVAYSLNSSSDLATVASLNLGNLTTAQLSNVSADLMHFVRENVLVNYGDNNLAITLKHKYSQITTRVTMDANTTGNITNISSPTIRPTFETGSIQLRTGVVSYNNSQTTGRTVTFPALGSGTRNTISSPTLLISPTNTTTGTFNFGSITIDGETRTNVVVPNVNIYAGGKYNLNVTFATCTEVVGSVQGFNWNYAASTNGSIVVNGTRIPRGGTLSQTITASATNYGFTFDIYQLDNSFNMQLNGVTLATREIQFEPNISDLPQNIRFRDGSLYQGANAEGGPNISPIYNMVGTAANPLIRVLIGRNGDVQMLGSKVSGGPLYELELINGNSFNTFRWNSTQTNRISVTQRVDGATKLIGSGSGRNKIPCN